MQSSIVPPKPRPAPRRTGSRTLEAINGFFDGGNSPSWGSTGRRHTQSQQQPLDDDPVPIEEPNPRQRSVYAGMTLAEAMRRGVEEDQIRRTPGARRLTLDSTPAQQSQGGYVVNPHHGAGPGAGANAGRQSVSRPGLVGRTSSNSQALDDHRQRRRESALNNNNGSTTDLHHHQQYRPNLSVRINSHDGGGGGVEPISHVWNTPEARRSITRSRALATRQARYRDSGSRDAPVLVESDHSEDD